MKKPITQRRYKPGKKTSGVQLLLEKWMNWLEKPFKQLALLPLMIPQAQPSRRLIIHTNRAIALIQTHR